MYYSHKEIIGLSDRVRNNIYRFQENENWCWAAATQMVLLKHDIYIDQKVLSDLLSTKKLCYPNCAANFESVAKLLDGQEFMGQIIRCAAYEGLPNPVGLIKEIKNNNPLIIGVWESSDVELGHAVVLTNLETVNNDGINYITKLIVIDPENTIENMNNNGLRFYGGKDITKILRSYLIIKTVKNEVFLK